MRWLLWVLRCCRCYSNGRWIGDLPLRGGGQIRSGSWLRCGEFDSVSGEGSPTSTGSTWGDSRSAIPARDVSAASLLHHPGYRHRPFIDELRDHERDPAAEGSRADLYRGSLRRNGRTIAAAVQTILTAPAGPVVMHCKSRVDRTGMLTAVILDCLGVERTLIAEDYATFASTGSGPVEHPPTTATMTQTLALPRSRPRRFTDLPARLRSRRRRRHPAG